jgi:hypothetical protein
VYTVLYVDTIHSVISGFFFHRIFNWDNDRRDSRERDDIASRILIREKMQFAIRYHHPCDNAPGLFIMPIPSSRFRHKVPTQTARKSTKYREV